MRRLITEEKVRPDRGVDQIRPLSSEVLLPRTHGSGLFTRGQTQALSVCTLGALGDVQILDGLGVEESKRFMHHYNFPQFSVGETYRCADRDAVRSVTALLESVRLSRSFRMKKTSRIRSASYPKCLNQTVPLHISICASTLAMMDAGVPIKAPVAGIAMGLVKSGEYYTVLTDIQGMEDALGDMDFKVAGTEKA